MARPLLVFLWLLPLPLAAQTYTATPALTIANERVVLSVLPVTGLPGAIEDSIFGLESLCLNLAHPSVKQLIITLYAPDGTMVKISHLNGKGDDFQYTCFRDDAKPIQWANPPYEGGYRPVLPLGGVNNGQNPNGNWRLYVHSFEGDTSATGLLERWSLTFGKRPAPHPHYESSNLPVLRIRTGGRYIPDEPKIKAQLAVVDGGPVARNGFEAPASGFDGPAGIEWRGASSKSFWQPSYTLETRDASGDDLDVPLLGLPAESDWVLHGPFNDKSLLRNALTFALARDAGPGYVPRTRFCELVLDGAYLGIYLLIEKIKPGASRVPVAKMKAADSTGLALTGGYIVQVDRTRSEGWYSPFRSGQSLNLKKVYFNYVYPKPGDITAPQMAYIQRYVDSFEQALFQAENPAYPFRWRQFAHEDSFVDLFLFNELCKNVDAYRLSTYFYKNASGKTTADDEKLHAGPLWDFNLAWRNANYNDNENPAGWTFDGSEHGVPFWWRKLLADSAFAQKLHCRWEDLRAERLSQRRIFGCIDSLAAVTAEARARHFELYPILGRGLWPNPKPIAKTYEEEIRNMKSWIGQRLAWMDAQLPGICPKAPAPAAPAWLVYPNPVRERLYVYFEAEPAEGLTLEIVDAAGRLRRQVPAAGFETVFDLDGLDNGCYFLVCRSAGGGILNAKVVVVAGQG